MKINKLIILGLILSGLLSAQTYDGTVISQKQIDFEQAFNPTISSVYLLNRDINVSVHLVKNTSGGTYLTPAEIAAAFNDANILYSEIGVTLNVWKIDTVDNYNYNTLNVYNVDRLVTENNIENTINMYFVSNLYNTNSVQVDAYTYMPGDSLDIMFFDKEKFDNLMLKTQLCRFFNLYYTDEDVFGEEAIERNSSCYNTGDKCCDTPADPGLTESMLSNDNECEYRNLDLYNHPSGNNYVPDTKNYMSHTRDGCKCYLSPEQYIRMMNAIMLTKQHLW